MRSARVLVAAMTLAMAVLTPRAAAPDVSAEPVIDPAWEVAPPWTARIAAGSDAAVERAGEPRWTVRIAVGRYAPVADRVPLVFVELDRQLRFAGGRVGIAASIGYLQSCAQVTPHETLRFVPLFAGLVYRTPALGFAFAPLVLSAKLGPAYQVWQQEDARGAKLGWRGAVGVALRLDQLDPDAQRSLADETGIQHTAVSLELTYFGVEGFPRTLTWSLGLDLDF